MTCLCLVASVFVQSIRHVVWALIYWDCYIIFPSLKGEWRSGNGWWSLFVSQTTNDWGMWQGAELCQRQPSVSYSSASDCYHWMASHHHSKSSSAFAPRRSNATTVRSSASAGSGRPRSLNLYGPSAASSSSYGGILGLNSGIGGYGSDTSYHGGHVGYGSSHSYGSSSSISTYGGTTSGYGGLTLHHASSSPSSSSSHGLLSSPSCSSYYSSLLQTPVSHVHNGGSGSGSSSSRVPSRTSSFNRGLSSSRNLPLSSVLGSCSGSLMSLASSTCSSSEGYLVSQHQFRRN